MDPTVAIAKEADAPAIVRLRNRVAAELTDRHGRGHWSYETTEKAVLRSIADDGLKSRWLVAHVGAEVVGVLHLVTKKPWAIDPAYFHPVKRALYVVGMTVAPEHQRHGIGRRLLAEAVAAAKAWPAGSIRLDAYDSAAGAGPFYARCGFTEVGRVTYRTVPLIYFERVL